MNYRYLVNTLHSVNRVCTHLAMPSDEAQDDEVLSLLGWFWASHDRSQFLLDSVPPDALKDLSTIAGKPWVLATRRALDALADCLRCTRPLDMQGRVYADLTPDERADALDYWGTTDVEVWIALRDELRQHFLTLKAIRGKHYPGWSGGRPDAPPPDSPPELQADPAAGGDGMTWQEVQGKLEARRLKGKQYTSRRKLAKAIGCSPFQIQKAIHKGTVELQEWASKHRPASRLNAAPEVAAVAFDRTPQAREHDPADIVETADVDLAMAYLLDQAAPNERARINAMTPAERQQLAETVYRDPDTEEQVLRNRRPKHSRQD